MGEVPGGNSTGNAGGPKPDWAGKWGSYGAAPVWQLVALSCNLDPENAAVRWFAQKRARTSNGLGSWEEGDFSRYAREVPEQSRRVFLDCLDIAESHVKSGDLSSFPRKLSGNIRLADFAQWAESAPVKWILPPEFPRAAASANNREAGTEGTLSTKERTSLLVIIHALAKMAKLDIEKPAKAAMPIVSALQQEGVKIAPRTVQDWLNRVPEAVESRRT